MNDKKDFFISYNTKDEHWATWIAGALEENGYSTIIQAWDFRPGNNFILKMDQAAKECRKTILVLSNNYMESLFCQPEWASAFKKDPTGNKRSIIPVKIDDASPSGLLEPIVYIDLSKCSSEEETQSVLLDGIKEGSVPRVKPDYPGKSSESVVRTINSTPYDFTFTISKDNTLEELTAETKSLLRRWFFNGCTEDFKVTIYDKRIDVCNSHLEEVMQKIQRKEDLSIAEENLYGIYTRAINKCKRETDLKRIACSFFLKDSSMRGYLPITSPIDLYEFIGKILNFDYYNKKGVRVNDPSDVVLNFAFYPSIKGYCNYFTVPLKREQLTEVFAEITNYSIAGYAADLGCKLLKEVVIYYYLFLAELILDYNMDMNVITQNRAAMDLLSYRIGLH